MIKIKFSPSGWDFKTRVYTLAILPVTVISIILAYYVTSSRINDAEQSLLDRGNALISPIIRISEFELYSGNMDLLTSMSKSALQDSEIENIKVFDFQHKKVLDFSKSESIHGARNSVTTIEKPIYNTGIKAFDYQEEFEGNNANSQRQILGWIAISLSNKHLMEMRSKIYSTSTIIILSGLLFSIFLAVRISKSVTNPIRRLLEMENRLREGDFDARVEVKSGGDLGVLEQGFNELAVSLHSSDVQLKYQIKAATEKLIKTVAELEQKNLDLDRARQEAQQANDVKADFLAKMSHEIRTPMNAVLGFSDLLRKTRLSEEQSSYIRTIHQSAQQLLTVIDDILSFSKLESGTIRLEKVSFDLRNCVENVVTMLGPAAHNKYLELILLVDSDVPERIVGDSARLSQILINLTNNAIKFTHKGSVTLQVSIKSIENNSANLLFSVMDTGVGIVQSNQQDLFSAFVQADSSLSRNYGGSGLGLAIAKRFVEMMGGDIGFESEEGKGSTFWVHITCPIDESVQVSDYAMLLKNVVALIYDSNPFSRRAIRNNLLLANAQTFIARNLEQVCNMLDKSELLKRKCNLVILGLTQKEALNSNIKKIIDEIRTYFHGPLVFLVSAEQFEIPDKYLKDSSVAWMTKPMSRDLFYLKINSLVNFGLIGEENMQQRLSSGIFRKYSNISILLAEDNNFNRILVTRFLRDHGITVEVAVDGEQALMFAEREPFDLILMDIHLPYVSGEEVVQHIRNSEGPNQYTPVVALTADVFADKKGNLTGVGVNDLLFKPITEDRLFEKVNLWIWKTRTGSQLGSMTKAETKDARQNSKLVDANELEQKDAYLNLLPEDLREKLYQELPQHQERLSIAIEKGNYRLIREGAHQLKGVAGYFSELELSRCAGQLENAAMKADSKAVAKCYQKLLVLIQTIVADKVSD